MYDIILVDTVLREKKKITCQKQLNCDKFFIIF